MSVINQIRRWMKAAEMPTEKDAIAQLSAAMYRLKEMGWREPMYAPRDPKIVIEVIEPYSVGIFDATYFGGVGWFSHDAGDSYPSEFILWRYKKKRPV